MAAIITLTTDLGTKDFYLSAVKALLLCRCPDAKIVDISHEIAKHNILEAAFALVNSYPSFPPGTVHIVGVDAGPLPQVPYLVVTAGGQHFIAADNGIFSLLFSQKPEQIIELPYLQEEGSRTFPLRDLLAGAACRLAQGNKPGALGKEKGSFSERMAVQPVTDLSGIRGNIIHIDSYENLITDITQTLFQRVVGRGSFVIRLRHPGYEVSELSRTYSDVPEGEMAALFGTTGLLEIAINKGAAASLLGIRLYDPVRVELLRTGSAVIYK